MLKLMIDTNVATKLSSGYHGLESVRIKEKIATSFHLVVSPQTLIELMNGVIGGTTDAHLKGDQNRLRVAVGDGTPDVLRFPGDFALRTVLGIESSVPAFDPTDFQLWVSVILAATTLDDLVNGHVKVPGLSEKTYGLDKVAIAKQLDHGKVTHQEWLQLANSRSYNFPSRTEWAKRLASVLSVQLDDVDSALLGDRLSAAYEYQKSNFGIAKTNPGYNIAKHDGDWIDGQQLFYLCDPEIVLLTDEANIRLKCVNSDQCSRILLLKEL